MFKLMFICDEFIPCINRKNNTKRSNNVSYENISHDFQKPNYI